MSINQTTFSSIADRFPQTHSQSKISNANVSQLPFYHPHLSLPFYSATHMPPARGALSMPFEQHIEPTSQLHQASSLSSTPYVYANNFAAPNIRTAYSTVSAPHVQATTLPPKSSQPLHQPTPVDAAPPAITTSNLQRANDHRPIRKLYDLPEFYGQPEEWPKFIVSYTETTHCYSYTQLENLTRLQQALKGDARAKVEAYLIHPSGVDHVIRTLEFHYGRPDIMIRSQIAKVRAFPSITGKKMSELVNFSTLVANLTVFLENAGATPHLNNPTLLDELVKNCL